MERITTREQLRALYGEPGEAVKNKIHDHLTEAARDFIGRSPLLFLGTRSARGLEVSPKGDPAGFVRVVDERTLVIPDRPGNKLLMGYEDILECPEVGLIFLCPPTTETLRVSGVAELWHDPELQAEMGERGKAALLTMRIHVRECFFHCGKALIRSHVWKPEQWGAGFKINWSTELQVAGTQAQWDAMVAREYSENL